MCSVGASATTTAGHCISASLLCAICDAVPDVCVPDCASCDSDSDSFLRWAAVDGGVRGGNSAALFMASARRRERGVVGGVVAVAAVAEAAAARSC